jgi:hypothetical protein
MTTLTFREAIAQAEVQARTTLPSELHDRLSCAVALVTDGRVFQDSDRGWHVDSVDQAGLTYSVNGTCTCKDYQYNHPHQGLCKHRLAVYLSRRAAQLMQEPPAPVVPGDGQAPLAPATSETTIEPSQDPDVTSTALEGKNGVSQIPSQYITLIQGKPFVKFAGLLQMAHAAGLVSLTESWTYNDNRVNRTKVRKVS